MNRFLVFSLLIFLVACTPAEKKKVQQKQEELIMYSPSELATLMERMYQYNDSIKKEIEKGNIITQQFPDEFLKIHTAEMTDRFERNDVFETFAKTFVEHQKSVVNASKEEVKRNFNNAINTCVACHQTSCTGPIPRIKKLLIK